MKAAEDSDDDDLAGWHLDWARKASFIWLFDDMLISWFKLIFINFIINPIQIVICFKEIKKQKCKILIWKRYHVFLIIRQSVF
jgi:hypothetical protein